jgi:hypothetical protein
MRVGRTVLALGMVALLVWSSSLLADGEGTGCKSGPSHNATGVLASTSGQSALWSLPPRSVKDDFRKPTSSLPLPSLVRLLSLADTDSGGGGSAGMPMPGLIPSSRALLSLHCLLIV